MGVFNGTRSDREETVTHVWTGAFKVCFTGKLTLKTWNTENAAIQRLVLKRSLPHVLVLGLAVWEVHQDLRHPPRQRHHGTVWPAALLRRPSHRCPGATIRHPCTTFDFGHSNTSECRGADGSVRSAAANCRAKHGALRTAELVAVPGVDRTHSRTHRPRQCPMQRTVF